MLLVPSILIRSTHSTLTQYISEFDDFPLSVISPGSITSIDIISQVESKDVPN